MILVTGATGLTGSHILLRLLEQGCRVRAVVRNQESISKARRLFSMHSKEHLLESAEWIVADLTDIPALETAFKDVRQVYHCAALISFNPQDEELLRKTNIEGTANIVNLCLAYNVEKLCHVSSTSALGDKKPGETEITENSEWNPNLPHSDYAISKYGAEMEIWRGEMEGLHTVIINPGIIIGGGFWESGSGKIFSIIKSGFNYYTEGITGYVSVDDVVDLMIMLMQSQHHGIRLIAVAENLKFSEVLFSVADELQVKRPSKRAGAWLTSLAWKLDWLKTFLTGAARKITREDAAALHANTYFSSERSKKLMNFSYRNIRKTIKEVVDLYRDYSTRGSSGSIG